jgi:hypothetical protein
MAPVAIFGILDLELPWKLDVGIWNFGAMALLFRKKRTTMQVSVLMILQRSSAAT